MKRHFAPDMRSISTVGCAAMLGLAVCGPALLAQSKSREMAPPAEKGEPLVVELWTGKVPDETGEIGAERVRLSPALDRKQVEVTEPTRLITDVSRPSISVYRPPKHQDTGTAIVICPGGGYWDLYWQLEGEEVAAWLNSQGITGIILKYRVPRRPDDVKGEPARRPLQDAQRAVSLVRSKASEWGLNPQRIGMAGFSAGGHLAIATATRFDKRAYEPQDDVDRVSCRPDFAILAYPGYLKAKDKDELSPALSIPPGTPPVFLVHGDEDIISPPEHSVSLYFALKRAGIPTELHIYARSAHDFGVRTNDHPCSAWTEACERWLRHEGFLPSATAGKTNQFRFSFGTGQPVPGFVAVSRKDLFKENGTYGFEPGASISAEKDYVTSDQPFLFSVKLPEGNYAVTLTLGDELGETSTTVKAEARRLMLENVRTAKGEVVRREMTVNIRTPRIDSTGSVRLKQRERDSEVATWDDALTLEFNGSRPCLRTLEVVPAPAAPTVFVAGDSTVCDQPAEPWNSWGQMLPRFLRPGVAVANYAESGESIKSSLSAGRFEKIFSVMKPGDWLLVQFGHNDMKDRAADALENYREGLRRLVDRTRERGGTPVLITSMERKAGAKAATLGEYPEAVRGVARERSAALIDLQALSVTLYRALGTNLDRAFQDGTHHNNYGSYELAKCVAAGIAHGTPDLARFVVEEAKGFDPSNPDPVAEFNLPPSPARSAAKPDGS